MSQTTTPLIATPLIATPLPGTYVLDASHSSVEFVARHLMISKTRGRFGRFSGTFEIAGDPLASRVEVEIDAASIDTGDARRDEHLRSPDFFDVANHPTLSFRSTGVVPDGDQWRVTGDLTIRGVTHPVSLNASYEGTGADPWGNVRFGLTASGKVNREDWGLTWNQALEAGGVLVSKDITLELSAEAIRQG